jgi:hypothetical protein
MTRKDDRNLQGERRLRNATWEREPVLPSWALWLGLAIASPFIASLIGAAA